MRVNGKTVYACEPQLAEAMEWITLEQSAQAFRESRAILYRVDKNDKVEILGMLSWKLL